MNQKFKLQLGLFLLFFMCVIVIRVSYIFFTYPLSNIKMAEFASKQLNTNRAGYDYLIGWMDTLEKVCPEYTVKFTSKNYIDFNDACHENKYRAIDQPGIKSSALNMNVNIISKRYRDSVPYLSFTLEQLDYDALGKTAKLLFFPLGYEKGFFKNDSLLLTSFSSKKSSEWLYRIDDHWILKSNKVSE